MEAGVRPEVRTARPAVGQVAEGTAARDRSGDAAGGTVVPWLPIRQLPRV